MKRKVNFIVKVYDAKAKDIEKALKTANIEVRNVSEVHSEEVEDQDKSPEEPAAPESPV